MNRYDGSLAAKHAAVVRRAIARQVERIDRLEALGFSTVGAERALEVVLKLFEERERKFRASAAPRQRGSPAPRCVSPPLVPSFANCLGVAVSLPESRRSPTYAWASIRAFGIDLKPEREIEPEDLLKYGLIPEFVGRLPVIATLEDLDEASLKLILTQPKNALVKQYQRLFEMEGVDLTVAGEALGAIIIAFISHSDFPEPSVLNAYSTLLLAPRSAALQ